MLAVPGATRSTIRRTGATWRSGRRRDVAVVAGGAGAGAGAGGAVAAGPINIRKVSYGPEMISKVLKT